MAGVAAGLAMRKKIRVRIKRQGDVPLPYRATAGAAGLDLHAAEAVTIPARGFGTVPTGLTLELPEGIEGQIRPRSGLAAQKGIGILNSPGTIDSDYRGEIKVVLFNISDSDFRIQRGDRIAQLVFSRVIPIILEEAETLTGTERGGGGFGHTG